MPDSFFGLSREDQAALLRLHAPSLDMEPFVVEKDIWVCWALEQLFSMPGRLPMAFKGGTSLSKVYKAIDRFSEDIDITLDYRGFGEPVNGKESRAELVRISDKLKAFVLAYTRDTVKPFFEKVLTEQFGKENCRVELNETGEKVYIHYPSVLEQGPDYLASSVLLEFGSRNITEPNESHAVCPYLADLVTDYTFPQPTVTVLALPRTFWEKATLVHVECNRPNLRPSAERLSRHWFDLYKLSQNLAYFQSADAQDLLADVVYHKKIFFHYGYANYDACLSGGLRLVPAGELRKALEADFGSMVAAGMFYGDPPPFQKIMDRLTEVEHLLNESIVTQHKLTAEDMEGVKADDG
jgi:hypothetical protein